MSRKQRDTNCCNWNLELGSFYGPEGIRWAVFVRGPGLWCHLIGTERRFKKDLIPLVRRLRSDAKRGAFDEITRAITAAIAKQIDEYRFDPSLRPFFT
ncbi:MAG: hypothetical protein JSU68_01410 [Phycisphaerales bacterium]|nr:MAG: hypothetical protein JSU68_01410 [Phycisphaerales bacterium]